MEVHDRIRKLRDKENLSREDFAKALGVTYDAMSKYETGKRRPDYETLQKIADYFNVSTDYLLGRDEKKQSPRSDEEEFEKFLNDPRISKLYSEYKDSPEKRREALFAAWEIIKTLDEK
ncbi:helix-turn-helix domain-containing protein [Planococcus sp. YIM B11945]|uniref:helix-turn-helix domain-containing protein n=1 Tax=Planococcus sp. YIM B11945 TaxID=3435410 RepID=UPI003D7CD966